MSRTPRDELPVAATILDFLRWRAEHQPERRSHTFLKDGEIEGDHLTFGQLERRARAIAAHLQSRGAAGRRVLLLYPPGLEYIAAFYGCLFAGAVAVPAYPPDPTRLEHSMPRLAAIVEDCKASAALTSTRAMVWLSALSVQTRLAKPLARLPLPSVLGRDAIRGMASVDLGVIEALEWIATDRVGNALAAQWRPVTATPDTVAYLQYTSGSTAAPRGVMVRHGNVIANLAMGTDLIRVTEESSAVGWVPLYHDLGLVCYAMGSAYNGCYCVLMSPVDFLQKPVRWLQAIARHRTTHNAAPNFGYDLCVRRTTPEQRAALDLRSWKVAGNGGEPVRHETLKRFAEAFRGSGFRAEASYPTYGLAEATLFVSCGKAGDLAPRALRVRAEALEQDRVEVLSDEDPRDVERAVTVVSNGRSGPGHQVRIVDPESRRPCAASEVGEIWFMGPSVSAGYWGRVEESSQIFAARVDGEPGGSYLRTGDLGFLHDGELYITGRLKDLIILHGRNHYPLDIEETVWRCHPALRKGCGAAFADVSAGEEQLVVVQEMDDGEAVAPAALAAQIRGAVFQAHEARVERVVLIRKRTIPKTSSGKIQRRACREQLLAGKLSVLFEDPPRP